MFSKTIDPPAARLIVCERTGDWASALRRELCDSSVRVWETRRPADCQSELLASPASFVVLQMLGDVVETLRLVAQWSREFPAARVAVAAERRRADAEWFVREAGAVHFLCSPRQTARLARLACRHLAEIPSPQNWIDRIWANLPFAPPARPEISTTG